MEKNSARVGNGGEKKQTSHSKNGRNNHKFQNRKIKIKRNSEYYLLFYV